ncbi:hypothetical protein B0H11DRAFT_2341838 [Mycena galericulata]|nr:hypothetical protein B0H11DRAFT_2341838 [Mycena galericulata]
MCSSDRHGSPAGIGALTRTRTRQNPYPRVRVRVRVRVSGVTRDPRNPSEAMCFLVKAFSPILMVGVPAAFKSLSGGLENTYNEFTVQEIGSIDCVEHCLQPKYFDTPVHTGPYGYPRDPGETKVGELSGVHVKVDKKKSNNRPQVRCWESNPGSLLPFREFTYCSHVCAVHDAGHIQWKLAGYITSLARREKNQSRTASSFRGEFKSGFRARESKIYPGILVSGDKRCAPCTTSDVSVGIGGGYVGEFSTQRVSIKWHWEGLIKQTRECILQPKNVNSYLQIPMLGVESRFPAHTLGDCGSIAGRSGREKKISEERMRSVRSPSQHATHWNSKDKIFVSFEAGQKLENVVPERFRRWESNPGSLLPFRDFSTLLAGSLLTWSWNSGYCWQVCTVHDVGGIGWQLAVDIRISVIQVPVMRGPNRGVERWKVKYKIQVSFEAGQSYDREIPTLGVEPRFPADIRQFPTLFAGSWLWICGIDQRCMQNPSSGFIELHCDAVKNPGILYPSIKKRHRILLLEISTLGIEPRFPAHKFKVYAVHDVGGGGMHVNANLWGVGSAIRRVSKWKNGGKRRVFWTRGCYLESGMR